MATPPPIPKPSLLQQTIQQIDILIRARYPVLYLLTHEENRVELLVADIARNQQKPLFGWTATQGMRKLSDPLGGTPAPTSGNPDLVDPHELLKHIQTKNVGGIYLLKDFHPFLDDPHVVRRLRDVAADLKGSYKTILLCSPRLNLPAELEKDVSLIDVPLPDAGELFELLKSVCVAVGQKNKEAVKITTADAWEFARAAQGLTLGEAENAFSQAVVTDSKFDRNDLTLVLEEKRQIIRKSGILDFFPADASLDEIGGLQNLKSWLAARAQALGPQAAEFGLPTPRGVLLLGAPGCGKSLTAKAISAAWRLPLLRLDFGKIFSGLVGSSEENMRRALKVAEGVAPTVLWIDEIEKGLAGGVQGSSDSGTAARVFGTFLTWMQEKKSSVFVIATANRIDMLPPELLRRGRFDEIFFLDLPNRASREEILRIHLKKRKRRTEALELRSVVDATEGFSGSELEHLVVEALFTAFPERRELTAEDLVAAAGATIPLSVTYAEELRRSREWAASRARYAEPPDSANGDAAGRASRLEVVHAKKAV